MTAASTSGRWVSVAERLPSKDSFVWTWDGRTVRSDQYWTRYDGVERFCCDEGFGIKTTHWMPNDRPMPPIEQSAEAAAQNVAEARRPDEPSTEQTALEKDAALVKAVLEIGMSHWLRHGTPLRPEDATLVMIDAARRTSEEPT